MDKKPRLRAPNFTSSDNLLLCDIIDKHKNIIENKKTDGANLLQKQLAWAEVVSEYNSCTTGYHRPVESLQQNYKNIKKKAKKNSSNAKMTVPVDKSTLVFNVEAHGTSPEGWQKIAEATGAPVHVDKSTLVFNVEAHGTSPEGWQKIAEATGAPEEKCQEVFLALTKECKREEGKLKKEIMRTGGGPPPTTTNSNDLLDKVKQLIGPAMDGMYTIYDGDSELMATQDLMPIEIKNMKIDKSSPGPSQEESNRTILKRKYDSSPIPSQEDDVHSIADTPFSDYFTNDRANLKKKPNPLLTRKKKLIFEMPAKQTVADKFKTLATEKMELVQLQKELLKVQLEEEKEKADHNRQSRAMQLEEMKREEKEKADHNRQIRAMQLEEMERLHEHNKILREMELKRV